MNYEKKSPVALSLSATVIKRIPPEGRPLKGLGYPVGTSALERHGFVRVSGNNGSEVVYLTPKGFAVSEAFEERIRAVEAEWRNRFGNEPVIALRRALEDVIATAAHAKIKGRLDKSSKHHLLCAGIAYCSRLAPLCLRA